MISLTSSASIVSWIVLVCELAVLTFGYRHKNTRAQSVDFYDDSSSAELDEFLDKRQFEPHLELPEAIRNRYTDLEELFAGSFGQVWKAVDIESQKIVALKMFYSKNASGTKHLVTWSHATSDKRLSTSLHRAAQECTMLRKMQTYARNDPTGASRVMQCFEDHVTLGTTPTGHTVGEDDELYLVFELCKGIPGDVWLKEVAKNLAVADPKGYFFRVLKIFKQLVQGIRYMTANRVKWVHHDLKPDNLVIGADGEGKDILKIIDFGAASEVSLEASATYQVATPHYAPPEWFGDFEAMLDANSSDIGKGYDYDHPWSFDVYSAGAILDEMVTGERFITKVKKKANPTNQTKVGECESLRRSRGQSAYSCKFAAAFLQVKGSNGAEHEVTKNWGKIPVDSEVVDAADSFLLSLVKFQDVSAMYSKIAKSSRWYEAFMSMMAFSPENRAKPETILQHMLMRRTPTVNDPSFDAEAAAVLSRVRFKPTKQVDVDVETKPVDALVAPRQST